MSDGPKYRPGSSEPFTLDPVLSPESQQDLDDALNETASAEDVKKAWVEESRRDLLNAFAVGRKVDPSSYKSLDVFSAREGTEKDLRGALVSAVIFAYCDVSELTVVARGIYMTDTAP